jgi:broad specificity phosphatase PhoE
MSLDLPSPLTLPSPLSILVIRHAEKTGGIWPGPGLTWEGKTDDKSLVIRGWARAGAWAALFATLHGAEAYPRPSAIYAANPEAVSLDETSQRPFQTVLPLCERLGMTPITTYSVGQESQLVSEVLHSSGIVLVSWEHKAITAKVAPGIAGEQNIEDLPHKWDESRYDVVLRFDRMSPDAPWSFCQLCPCLMSGDSTALLE